MNMTFPGYLEVYPLVSFDTDEHGPALTSVMLDGVDILPNLSDVQRDGLVDLAREHEQLEAEMVQAAQEDHAEYLYRQRKDEGMRADEPRRLAPKDGIRYLAEISDFESDDVLDWWAGQDFDLGFGIESGWLGNCVFCHKKSNPKLALAARDEPEMLNLFKKMVNSDDARQLGFTPKDQLYRGGKTIDCIISTYSNFDRDEIINRLKHSKRFDNSLCSESCEVFSDQIEIEF